MNEIQRVVAPRDVIRSDETGVNGVLLRVSDDPVEARKFHDLSPQEGSAVVERLVELAVNEPYVEQHLCGAIGVAMFEPGTDN